MTDTNNSQAPKSSTTKVVDKQSLYKHFYSGLQFELIVLAGAGVSWLFSYLSKTNELGCVWAVLGFGHIIVIFNIITGLREYSESLIIQKMRERSANVGKDEYESNGKQNEVATDQLADIPEFEIIATSASELPQLSADAQKKYDSLSLAIKKEYGLWSANIWLFYAVCIIFFVSGFFSWPDLGGFFIPFLEFCFLFFYIPFSLSRNDLANSPVVPSLPVHLTKQEPRTQKITLSLYIAYKTIAGTVLGYLSSKFIIVTISIVLFVYLYISIRLYWLRKKNKDKDFPKANILALWVFGTQNIWVLLEYLILPVWRKLGNIFLIRGGDHILRQVSLWDSLLFLRGKDLIISKTPEQITQKLNEFQKKTNRAPEYRFNTLICGDNSWQFALHSLIDEADLVVMHLSSFSPNNQGCIYELEQLINRVPVENFYLLVDRHSTDYEFLLGKLQELWKKMKSSSPNQKGRSLGIQIIFLEHAVKTPDEVEAIYKEMNSAQQNALDVLADTPSKKELVTQHETKKRQELEGLFRVLFAKAVQLSHIREPYLSP
jgi:hypothetical protein